MKIENIVVTFSNKDGPLFTFVPEVFSMTNESLYIDFGSSLHFAADDSIRVEIKETI